MPGVSAAAEEMAAVRWQHRPHPCALQVPTVLSSICEYLPDISGASARRSLNLLLLSMAEQNPRETILSLTGISPACERY